MATPIELKISPERQGCANATMAPYFCDYISHLILNNPAYGPNETERQRKLYRGGLTIVTTLDSRLQAAAQAQVDGTATIMSGMTRSGRVAAGQTPAPPPLVCRESAAATGTLLRYCFAAGRSPWRLATLSSS